MRFVAGVRLLVVMAALVGGWHAFYYMTMVVQILFATRELGLDEKQVGLCYIGLGVGSVTAGAFGNRISRRLRDAEAPAFQDTYGWIAYRQGNFEEAVTYLEPAAAGLPDDLLTQIHYGLALAAAGQKDKAMTQLQATLDKAGDSTLPQLLAAREVLAAMTAGAPVKPPFVVTTQGTAATP